MASSRVKRELTQKQLEQQSLNELYKRELDNLKKRIKTAEKAGWVFDSVIPRKPNTISPASVEKIKNIRGKSLYNKGLFQIPDTDIVLKPKKGMEYQKQASKLKELQTKIEKYPERFKPKTKEKVQGKAVELEKYKGLPQGKTPTRPHIKTTDDLIIEGRYVIDQNTGEIVTQLPAEYFVDNGNIYTELYNTRERPFFNPEEYGYQNTGNFHSIDDVEQKAVPTTDEDEGEYTDGTLPFHPDDDEWEWEGVTTEEPLYETGEVLEAVERIIDNFDPESAADETYTGRSKSANKRRNNAVDVYGRNKDTAQRILDDAIAEASTGGRDGRAIVARRLKDNAGNAIEATNALLYAYEDNYFNCMAEFASIMKGKPLTPEEAMDMEGEDTGLSSFFPNPHRRPPNNAGNSRR